MDWSTLLRDYIAALPVTRPWTERCCRRAAARGAWRHPLWRAAVCLATPALLCVFELLFQLFTGGRSHSLPALLLFSALYGAVWELALAFCPAKVRRGLRLVLLAAAPVPYLVESFVFQAFHVFYDVNTVLGGAGDAVQGFAGDIVRIVFSPSGLLQIALYYLPFFLYACWGRWLPRSAPQPGRQVALGAATAALYLASVAAVAAQPRTLALCDRQYNYQTAVGELGLLTGLRLDIGNVLAPRPLQFEAAPVSPSPTPAPPAAAAATAAPQPTPVVYDTNELPLALTGHSGTVAALDDYVAARPASHKNEYTGLFAGKNLIFLSAEAFCAEVIDPELTPTLYRLATKGIQFTDYYQPASAGTTGGEYQNLLGLLPTAGGMSFKNSATHDLGITIGHKLDALGYYGMAYHNNTYTYYSRDKTHINLGYSGGYMGYGNGMEDYVTWQWPRSDLEMIAGTLPTYIDRQPFDIYYMTVSGHGMYGRDQNAMARKNWERVAGLPYSDAVKGYLAANLELEDALTWLVAALEQAGIADDTVICLAADHFPYGLDGDAALGGMPRLSELYGAPVTNYLQRDHNRLILWCGSLEQGAPIVVDSPTFSLDILPTLCNLFGVEFDARLLPGRDVFSDAEALVFDLSYDWKTELGTYLAASGRFTPADGAAVPDGYVERISQEVRNRVRYCQGVLDTDYFATLELRD